MPDSDTPALSAKALMEICSRSMYSIDGLWFLAVEEQFGFEAAFKLNQKVWERCSFIHGHRLLNKLHLEGKPPLQALIALLSADPIMAVHNAKVTTLTDTRAVFRFIDCPIQIARIKAGRGVYNGKPGCTLCSQFLQSFRGPQSDTHSH